MAGFPKRTSRPALAWASPMAPPRSHVYDVPLPACVLAGWAGGGVSGMLPELDSASGVPPSARASRSPRRGATIVAERFKRMGMEPGKTLCWPRSGLICSFDSCWRRSFTHFSVHRGMFHSFPACLIAGEIAFLAVWARKPVGALFPTRPRS